MKPFKQLKFKDHSASFEAHLDVVQYIMERVEDKSPQDNEGDTPLHIACGNGENEVNFDVISYILDNVEVEDLCLKNKYGYTPAMTLWSRGYPWLADRIEAKIRNRKMNVQVEDVGFFKKILVRLCPCFYFKDD